MKIKNLNSFGQNTDRHRENECNVCKWVWYSTSSVWVEWEREKREWQRRKESDREKKRMREKEIRMTRETSAKKEGTIVHMSERKKKRESERVEQRKK